MHCRYGSDPAGGYDIHFLILKHNKIEKFHIHNVLASEYLTDCHQALFFQQDTLVY